MRGFSEILCVTLVVSTISCVTSQEAEFAGLIKNLLQGDELKTFQSK